MKILQICHKPPLPAVDGGCIAMNNITQGLLNAGHEVKVLCISTHKHPFEKEKISDEYLEKTKTQSSFIDTRVKPITAFINIFSNKSYNISRFWSTIFDELIKKTLTKNEFDIVQLEGLFVAPYLKTIQQLSKAKVIYRAHNIEFEIWERLAKNQKNLIKKWYLNMLAKRMKNYEIKILNHFDGIATITKNDAEKYETLKCISPLEEVSFSFDYQQIKNENIIEIKNTSIAFIGAFDWQPNLEGVKWFLEKVWPPILQKNPELEFHIAGRNMPDKIKNLQKKNIKIIGEIENAHEFISTHPIMVVPLFSGSGIRIKIIEAMALERAVVSTSLGAQGINCEHGKNIMIADTAEEFITTIDSLVNNSEKVQKISENASWFVKEEHDNKKITEKLVGFYEKIIAV
ncbi:MAG: glycosyl transferase family 4 [Flavobacteriales bacterium]|nr:MAG: glycosyl transferase family 4 [Flavobacteriales bacterium]